MCVVFFFWTAGGGRGRNVCQLRKCFIEVYVLLKEKAEIQHPFRHSIQQGVVTRGARNGRHVRRPAQFCNR